MCANNHLQTDFVLARARGPYQPHGLAEAGTQPNDMVAECSRRVWEAYDRGPCVTLFRETPSWGKVATKRTKMAPMAGAISEHPDFCIALLALV